MSVPDPVFTTQTPAGRRLSAALPVPGGQPDPIAGHGPARHWARRPADGLLHAIAPLDTECYVIELDEDQAVVVRDTLIEWLG